MTAVDDLDVGDWIAVIGFKHADEDDHVTCSGLPSQILAISLPFLAIRRIDGIVESVDVRDYVFQRVTQEYADAMLDAGQEGNVGHLIRSEEPDDGSCCPRCGCRYIERSVGQGLWTQVCPDCGHQGHTTQWSA